MHYMIFAHMVCSWRLRSPKMCSWQDGDPEKSMVLLIESRSLRIRRPVANFRWNLSRVKRKVQ
jgi:hypothetical protein